MKKIVKLTFLSLFMFIALTAAQSYAANCTTPPSPLHSGSSYYISFNTPYGFFAMSDGYSFVGGKCCKMKPKINSRPLPPPPPQKFHNPPHRHPHHF